MFSVKAIRTHLIPFYWDFVVGHIKSALDCAHGELLVEDVYNYLLGERQFLFVISDNRGYAVGAAVCEIAQYVRKKAVRIVLVGGKSFEGFDQWSRLLTAEVMAWANRIGADGVECYVRPGMAKKLDKIGYRRTYIGMWIDGKE